MAQNEPRIVSDLKLRDDNDDEDIEGVVHQEALEEAENVSKGTKRKLGSICIYLTLFTLQFKL